MADETTRTLGIVESAVMRWPKTGLGDVAVGSKAPEPSPAKIDLCPLLADFVAKVGNGKSEAVASMSLSGLLHPLHLAAGPLRQRH